MAETVECTALADVNINTPSGGMPLKKGEKYQIDAAEAAKLAKAGYVSIAGGKVAPAVPKQAKDS